MADLPITFSAPMVLALLADHKTQTRRVIADGKTGEAPARPPRYKVGDRLYVREAIAEWKPASHHGPGYVRFLADQKATFIHWPSTWVKTEAPPMYMPKTMSRLTLIVTDVRVECLQDISEADAEAEGIVSIWRPTFRMDGFGIAGTSTEDAHQSRVAAYISLWNSLNEDRAPWSTNPFVAAYTFTVHKTNIDRMKETP